MSTFANRDRWLFIGVGVIASAIALVSARPYAGSWNDGSRLATVESLVDRGTLSIDRSIFVDVPSPDPSRPSPYSPHDELLQECGTKDKLFIDGRYYSDKSPVPAYYLAAAYRAGRALGMPSAADRPDWFCLLMTWVSSGLAYVVAVMCLFSIARQVGLDCFWSIGVTFFFMAGTVALPYAQYVNNHILLLAVALVIFQLLLTSEAAGWTWRRMIALGTCAGIAYTIDLGAGPPLCALVLALSRKRLLLVVAALPWIVFHHIVNYQIGGSLAPANANPAFFDWPGSPFSEQNMTGGWNHANPLKAAVYALAMLFGKKGFLGHNLILFVPLIGLPWLLRRRVPEYRVILIGLIWAIGTWLLYASTSTNSSGGCCSVRWFVPLLAPAFVALCVLLRDHPAFRFDAVIAGSGGVLLGIGMAIRGPWFHKLMPFYFVIYFGTLMVWIATRWLMRTRPIALRQDITILSLRITGSTPLTLYSNRVWPNPDPVAANNRHFTLEVPGHRIHQALREDAIIPEAETTEQQAQSPHAESAARPTADTSRPAEPKPAETKPAAQKSGEEDEWLGFDLKFDNQPDLDLGKEK